MNTPLPKVVHPVAGQAMIERVLRAVKGAKADETRVVVGFGGDLVKGIVEPMGAVCFAQAQQRGTADAVRAAQPETLEGDIVILNGDHPLLETADIERFRSGFRDARAEVAVVTCRLETPGSFGRIVRLGDEVRAIVEAKDASAETLKINEVNTGIYVVSARALNQLLPKVTNKNAQGEFYLTDIISLAVESGIKVIGLNADARVALGVNTQAELASASRQAFARKAERLLESGVMMIQPDAVFVEDTCQVGPATMLYPGVFLKGTTTIGAACVIEPGCVVKDSRVGDHVHMKAGCYLDRALVGNDIPMGPYAHLRPDTEIGDGAHIGNFVEMKKVKFGKGSKANHLTYLGDAEVGENTNIGCGTITCNYAADRKKYVTKIGSGVFVGSDTQFIAPITIGDQAVIGSGSTITKDVPARALAVARGRQVTRENYVSDKKDK
jgi:bifunctional UDP-N-acetylglucosamine pyrophosphorylase/glucosamine-1-phosphate N-acetyltransferase